MSERRSSTLKATAKPALSLAEGIESWHKTVKRECIRPQTPLNVEDARRIVGRYVQHYDDVRLHSGIGYVTPRDRLEGRDGAIWQARHQKLSEAQKARRAARQAEASSIEIPSLMCQSVP